MRRLSAALTLAFLTATGLATGTATATATAADPVDRRLRDERITESSGLAPSLRHPGVLWTHNDSGHPARLFAVGPDGRTRAVLRVTGEPATDWEALTSWRDARRGPLLAIGDIGDNTATRREVRVAVVAEPARLTDAAVRPVRVLRLRYPDGPQDAEALLADPRSGRLYVVTKSLLGAGVYAVPASAWPQGRASGVVPLQFVAPLGVSLVTDGAALPDGRMLLRGYARLSLVAAPDQADDGRLQVLASADLPAQEQGESLAVVDGGRRVLVGSEGARSEVLPVPVPTPAGAPDDPTTGAAPDPTSTAPGTSAASAVPPGPAGPAGTRRTVLAGLGLLLALGAAAAVVVTRR